jgi:hypothetical protein
MRLRAPVRPGWPLPRPAPCARKVQAREVEAEGFASRRTRLLPIHHHQVPGLLGGQQRRGRGVETGEPGEVRLHRPAVRQRLQGRPADGRGLPRRRGCDRSRQQEQGDPHGYTHL